MGGDRDGLRASWSVDEVGFFDVIFLRQFDSYEEAILYIFRAQTHLRTAPVVSFLRAMHCFRSHKLV